MSHCEEYAALISAAVDGEITAAQRQQLEAHLASCAACRAEYDAFCQIHEAFGRMEAEVPEGLAVSVMGQIRREAAGSAWRRRRHWISVGAAAACCAVVVLGARVMGTLTPSAADSRVSQADLYSAGDSTGGLSDEAAPAEEGSVQPGAAENSLYTEEGDPSLESALTYFGGGEEDAADGAEKEGRQASYCATVVTEDPRAAQWLAQNAAAEGTAAQDADSGAAATVWLLPADQYGQLASYLSQEGIAYAYTGEAEETDLPADGAVRVVCLGEPESTPGGDQPA